MKKTISITTLVIASLLFTSVFAQLPKIDKSKIPTGKVKIPSSNNATTPANSENSKPTSSTNNSSSALSPQEQEAMYYYYQSATSECDSRVWIDGFYDDYFMSMIGNDFNKLQKFKNLCLELEKRIENDKKRTPETFKFYGNKAEIPAGMEFGGANNDALPSKLKWTNNSIIKYYKWKANTKNDLSGTAKSILKYVEASKERISANADLNTRIAYEYVSIGKELILCMEAIQGTNSHLQDASTKIEAQRQAIINQIKSKITGTFHENNLQKTIGFTKKQTLGKEIQSDISTELVPGKFTHIVAYAVEPQSRFGAKSALTTGGRETQPGIFIKFNGGGGNELILSQKIYCNSEIYNTMKDKFFVEFEWFPDLATVNYKSHLEYMPILHLGQYLMRLNNGKYSVNLLFGDDIHTDIGARGAFTILISDEIKANLKTYLEKLWQIKLKAVTFNSQYGDKDQRNIILNVEELKKYGYPEKVTVERTGKVMKPWPNENEVESFVGSGWGLFKREDGKYEVIGLGFVQKPGDSKWKWTSIASDMDYYILLETGNGDNYRVQPQRLGQGYEILNENIQKNGVW
jgi:hypothetical protein